MNAPQPDFRAMTAGSIGKNILQALVTEIKLLQDPWPKLSKEKQDFVIDRLRNCVETNVRMAVHLLASEGRTVVVGDLAQITIKDGVKAVIEFNSKAENLSELYDSTGSAVLVVVAAAAAHLDGMDKVQGEADQRAMDLGHEYQDNDGGGMEKTVDGEVLELPSPDDIPPSDKELKEAYDAGYEAAADGMDKQSCPVMRSELVAEWIKGWMEYHEDSSSED